MVEQKGTNNNAGFPVINAKRIAKATPAQKDKQKSQLNIFAKKLVAVDLHPFDNAPFA